MNLPRIVDPRAAPVAGIDAHLPLLGDERLSLPSLQSRLADAHVWTPEIPGDGRTGAQRAPAAAAVLIALIPRAHGLQVLLTRRTDHLRDHAGQISFPGGRAEATDDGPVGTALREAAEEVGMPPAAAQVVGLLPVYTTVTQFMVTPVVAWVQPPDQWALDAFEVSEVFEVPLSYLMNPAHHRWHVFTHEGGQRQFLSMPWHGPGFDGVSREYFIWGATAAILRNLYSLLARS